MRWKARRRRPKPWRRCGGGTRTAAPISWPPARIFPKADTRSAPPALQLRFVEAERASIADLYARGEIDDDARRRIERELDLEDSRLRHAAQSGAARLD